MEHISLADDCINEMGIAWRIYNTFVRFMYQMLVLLINYFYLFILLHKEKIVHNYFQFVILIPYIFI